jgi:hypothetical protein
MRNNFKVTREALFSSVSIRGTHLAETFRIFRSSCKMVSTDPTDMPALARITAYIFEEQEQRRYMRILSFDPV